ncbi:HAD-IA family hydrolase [Bradyrhizobium sp. ARR65]|uniref:HAD family hydrolase n=1 Tax=Bradyrhizobium sp. ARR65 TaxID=1040989 RepID=UPI00046400C3|nr:HAD-IA family hydrolase [Bradyrhizobium sp. ARR65]
MSRHYDAVLFDLLTALLDSWSLWNAVAGSEAAGRSWRAEYLRMTYGTGPYRPYEDMVRKAAERVGLPSGRADALAARYGELKPWPGVTGVLTKLRDAGLPLGVVTNCSEKLGRIAVGRVGVSFDVVVTAERAGFYKPDPRPYNLALEELGVAPERSLFVAGSPYDLHGTARVGLPAFWHDRMGVELEGAPTPIARHRDLTPLIAAVLG